MRRSLSLSRGAKGYNWYSKFVEQGADGFRRNVPPTPFDWTRDKVVRPVAYFELALDAEPLGRLEFELAEDVAPKTVANFVALCTGRGVKHAGYKGTRVHQVQKGQFLVAGDVCGTGGKSSHAAGSERLFADENYIIPHSGRGLLSMSSTGINTNGSQFYVSMSATPQMNGRCVVFGRLMRGESVLQALDGLFCFRGVPARSVNIVDCGVLLNTVPVVAEGFGGGVKTASKKEAKTDLAPGKPAKVASQSARA